MFPPDWPENCPPNDARDPDEEVFRIVKNNPCTADDFKSQKELGRAATAQDQCIRCGVSVYTKLEDARNCVSKYPRLGKYISVGALDKDHGRIKHTGVQTSHHTWWPFENTARHEPFDVLDD